MSEVTSWGKAGIIAAIVSAFAAIMGALISAGALYESNKNREASGMSAENAEMYAKEVRALTSEIERTRNTTCRFGKSIFNHIEANVIPHLNEPEKTLGGAYYRGLLTLGKTNDCSLYSSEIITLLTALFEKYNSDDADANKLTTCIAEDINSLSTFKEKRNRIIYIGGRDNPKVEYAKCIKG